MSNQIICSKLNQKFIFIFEPLWLTFSKNREKSAPNKPIVAFAVEFCIICSSSWSFIRPAMFHSELEWKVGLGGGRGA